jgi:polyferredoxin
MDLWDERLGVEVQPPERAALRRKPMLITILLAIVILALILYVLQLLPLDGAITRVLQILVLIVVAFYLLERFGAV